MQNYPSRFAMEIFVWIEGL